jgi:hypothetical protein
MKFFPTREDTPTVPDAADPTPISAPPAEPDEPVRNLADTGTRHAAPDLDDRADCPACRGTGKQLTTNDYLNEIVGMLPEDAASRDGIIAEFYTRLVGSDTIKGAAPHLREFFPPDLTTGDALNSHGNKQRDQLFGALANILTRYDPDHPDSEEMRSLIEAAKAWGRSHSEWQRRDGSFYIPTEEDYLTVRNVLAQLLSELLGGKFAREHFVALVLAYRTVSLEMQRAADEWRMQRGAPSVARRARPAAAR